MFYMDTKSHSNFNSLGGKADDNITYLYKYNYFNNSLGIRQHKILNYIWVLDIYFTNFDVLILIGFYFQLINILGFIYFVNYKYPF
jgi:hypothetical protein